MHLDAPRLHRSLLIGLLAIALLTGALAVPTGAAPTSFDDVPADHVFAADVAALARAGITRGCGTDRFCPDDPVTRGQMAAFLTRALDLPAGTSTLRDTRGHVFAADVAALARAGITRGCGTDRFCPDDPVTRGQMAAFLTRALDLPAGTGTLRDTRGHVFAADVAALARAGITRGCGTDRFCPDDPVTRGQMAAFLTRALDLPAGTSTLRDTRGHVFAADVAALARAGITRGCGTDRFCPDDPVTRGQMAAFLTRAGLTDGVAPFPGPAGRSFGGPVVGAHVHATWSHYDDDLRGRVLDQLAAAGITSIRVDMGWSAIEERCSGCVSEWYVERIDRTLEQAAARGIDVLGVLWRTPSWATDGGTTSAPDDPDEYGRVAGWVAQRFAGRVAAWQLWNEPDLDSSFRGTTEQYVELVRAAAPAIHAADPTTRVVLGGPSHNDTPWLRDVLARGVGDLVDVVAVQPYHLPSDTSPSLPDTATGDPGRFLHLATVIEVVEEFAPGTPVWLTEFGWSTHATPAGTPMWERGVTREQQAAFTVEALRLVEQRFPSVERAYLYRALDRDRGDFHQDDYGLLDTDARPKPVIGALRELLGG